MPRPSEELQTLDQMQRALASLLDDMADAMRHGNYPRDVVEAFRTRYAALAEQLATVGRFVRYSEIIEDAEGGQWGGAS